MFWCLGMFSSASTWTFNVVQRIAVAAAPADPPRGIFLDFADRLPAMPGQTLVVKTHGSEIADDLGQQAAAIVITVRDPRDAIVSLMQHNKLPFEIALRMTEVSAWTCGRFMAHPRALVLRFEDRFFDDRRTVDRIAVRLSARLPAGESGRIFDALRRQEVDAFIAGLEMRPTTRRKVHAVTGQRDLYDPATGWHAHHAGRTGESGRWGRYLPEAQVGVVERRLRVWMERVGYDAVSSRGASYRLGIGRVGVLA